MRVFLTLFLLFLNGIAFTQSYKYETAPNDPTETRIYTLKNGLKVYLSVNKEQPRIQTYIVVKTGSKNDPADVTGLAHYLEHMVFKGTSRIGTQDWEKEKVLLKEISDLYEAHKKEQDPDKKKAIYHKIDSTSGVAAKFAIANEYDKMISGLGAKGTNAFTSFEETVYVNDIPSTEMEKWMMVESERFSELVLRLFHTELEAVYEEFNIGQDNDGRKSFQAMNKLLFPSHPYGTQTTIGTGEHLKNPSMEKIHAYFNQYYVANNMAICMAGDFDYDKTIAMVDQYFGKLKSGDVNPRKMPIEAQQTEIKSKDVFGPTPENITIGFRVGGFHTNDAMMADLLSSVLSNGEAGLMDLNLSQKQKVLSASCYTWTLNDYSIFMLNGNPKEGQTLEELKALLMGELEKVKKGEFTDELLKAILKNNKKDILSQLESNRMRVSLMSDAFIFGANWKDMVSYYDRMEKITKDELVKWANEKLKDNNYCVVYKQQGEDKNIYKVDKPSITPVELNRSTKSDFYSEFEKKESSRLKPIFIDYKKELQQKELTKGVSFYYIPNKTTDLFTLVFELDEDLQEDKKVRLATSYLEYLGTDKYTPEEIKMKFYSMGVNYSVYSSYIMLNGLNESFDEALALLENILANCKPNEEALKNLIDDLKKKRIDTKTNKSLILNGIRNYATYGVKNKFNTNLSEKELDAVSGEELVKIIHNLTSYKHSIMYYGKTEMNAVYSKIKKEHKLPKKFLSVENKVKYPELDINENTVYYVDYDMVQTQMMMISKGKTLDVSIFPAANLFNSYFGSGLSSIVFQEIRESKALAYSAGSGFTTPNKKDESHYVRAFIGTQANKLPQAVEAMLELMNNMPKSEIQFNESKTAALKKIESDRIIKTNIYWSYRSNEKKGIDYDTRKNDYDKIQTMSLDDMENFFNENIKGKKYAYCVIGKKSDMDMEALQKLGAVKELTLEEIFGY